MRVRGMSSTGDMRFGQGAALFLVDSPEAVAQLIKTRLALWTGEWFLDRDEGMPWMQQVIGRGHMSTYDAAIQLRILETPGVVGIEKYSSTYNSTTRTVSISATVNTQYGITFTLTNNLFPRILPGA